MACCIIPPGQEVHTTTPAGKIIVIPPNIETYVTFPPAIPESPASSAQNPRYARSLLLLSDAHGIHLPSTQHLADRFAHTLHCPVIVPDQFHGSPHPLIKPPDFDNDLAMRELPLKHNPDVVDPIMTQVLEWMQRSPEHEKGGLGGVSSIGGIGYCFGARFIIRLLSQHKLAAGVINHPSFHTAEELRALQSGGPLAFYAAETDEIFTDEKRREMEDVLKGNGGRWMGTVFGGVEHGFSIRGDATVPEVRFAKQQAFTGAVVWLEEFLPAQ
ncbi:MAG: hypothetical protein Q9195_004052 [Heterodermia aff. obscurata]